MKNITAETPVVKPSIGDRFFDPLTKRRARIMKRDDRNPAIYHCVFLTGNDTHVEKFTAHEDFFQSIHTNPLPGRDAAAFLHIAQKDLPSNRNDQAVAMQIVARYEDILGDAVYTATLTQIARMIASLN